VGRDGAFFVAPRSVAVATAGQPCRRPVFNIILHIITWVRFTYRISGQCAGGAMFNVEKINLEQFLKHTPVSLMYHHGKIGLWISFFGIVLFSVLLLVHWLNRSLMEDYVWGAVISMPLSIFCMGIFSVLYEYRTRMTFINAMRSLYGAWDTGVTVLPSHGNAPDRQCVLRQAKASVRIMSTTLRNYFAVASRDVETKLQDGVEFKFIIYDPGSVALQEKAKEEQVKADNFVYEITSTCRQYLAPMMDRYGDKIKVKFCNVNTPFAATIIDERLIVLSLNVPGFARSKHETPCLLIENKFDQDSVFKLYERSFDTLWELLPESYPPQVESYFAPLPKEGET
jgi:hypothetical protein